VVATTYRSRSRGGVLVPARLRGCPPGRRAAVSDPKVTSQQDLANRINANLRMVGRTPMARLRLAMFAIGLILFGSPVLAHHSFTAEYDRNRPITLKGTITRVEWTNPHAMLYMEVTTGAGQTSNWEFELGSPNGLMKTGWNRYTIKKGDQITVRGFRARDGSNLVNADSIVLPDGKSVLSALSSGDERVR
jgi:hypothetical protein